jgi:hypothetical protein
VNKKTSTGKALEKQVADLYRELVAVEKVEHDKEMAGNQIDVYVEMKTDDGSLLRIAVEAKDHKDPVGVSIVNGYAAIVKILRDAGLIDHGLIVSRSGFTKPGRQAADNAHLRLLELADLEMWANKLSHEPAKPLPTHHEEINDLLKLFTYAAFMEVDYTGGDPTAVYSAIRRTRLSMGDHAWFLFGDDAAAIGFRSIQEKLYELERDTEKLYPEVAWLAETGEYKHLSKEERTAKVRDSLGEETSDKASEFIREGAVQIREEVQKLVADLKKLESS